VMVCGVFFFFSSRRRHTRLQGDWSSDVCSSDLATIVREASGRGYGADIIIEATGVLQALPEGFDMLRRGGQYVTCGHFTNVGDRSEERRVGKECRSRWSPYH